MNLSWMERAACAGEPPEIFFPKHLTAHAIAHAQAICRGCPVRVQCGQYAAETRASDGIWGGQLRVPWHHKYARRMHRHDVSVVS